jgi:hypothetical protein
MRSLMDKKALAEPTFNPWAYDQDGDCIINTSEKDQAIADWHSGKITMSDAMAVVNLWEMGTRNTACGDYQMPLNDLRTLLQKKFPKAQLLLLDKQYYYRSMKGWTKIFKDVLSNMPQQEVDRFDCENFAFLTIARVNERYRLNTIGFAIGMSWAHSFNVFIANDGVHTLDAKAGEIDKLNIVDFLIMG